MWAGEGMRDGGGGRVRVTLSRIAVLRTGAKGETVRRMGSGGRRPGSQKQKAEWSTEDAPARLRPTV